MSETAIATDRVMPREALLRHLQGHRRLTRRAIQAFPDDQLFAYSIGGMRSFGQLALEMLAMAAPMVRGIATDEWSEYKVLDGGVSKADILRMWDESTEEIDALWPRVSAEQLQATLTAFGQYTDVGYGLLLYVIDNETHHRGQGYVYLRGLGIEPPPFWERD